MTGLIQQLGEGTQHSLSILELFLLSIYTYIRERRRVHLGRRTWVRRGRFTEGLNILGMEHAFHLRIRIPWHVTVRYLKAVLRTQPTPLLSVRHSIANHTSYEKGKKHGGDRVRTHKSNKSQSSGVTNLQQVLCRKHSC